MDPRSDEDKDEKEAGTERGTKHRHGDAEGNSVDRRGELFRGDVFIGGSRQVPGSDDSDQDGLPFHRFVEGTLQINIRQKAGQALH